MTAFHTASRSAAPTTALTGTSTTTERRADPVALHFEAVNACAMARWYAARHDHAKAARKSAQALSALRRLAVAELVLKKGGAA